MASQNESSDPDGWARLRFAIIGPLLAAPPIRGELGARFRALSARHWRHPVTGADVQFGLSTIESWYYQARAAQDPVGALRRQRRRDAGRQPAMPTKLAQALHAQYRDHTGWTVQLHYDNLAALVAEDTTLGPLPSYPTVRRFMKRQGWQRVRPARRDTAGARQAAQRLEQFEVRSFEVEHALALWHLDFHHGARKVVTRDGRWVTPLALCVIDDHTRLVCHLQWYLAETAETLVHGLCQALQKRSLPRALMTDNGAAMQAEEFREGLHRLSILHEPTLPYSPYQNAKQETFWATLEGRLMAMLEGVTELTLGALNTLTQAWVEQEYNQRHHQEIGMSPVKRFLDRPSVGRPCPDSETLRQAFRLQTTRAQRRSDGTVSLDGTRFEIPSRFRHLERVTLRYARWDLRFVDLVDPHIGAPICPLYPLDKAANADGRRRRVSPPSPQTPANTTEPGVPPLLRQLLAEYCATGLPPAYLPTSDEADQEATR